MAYKYIRVDRDQLFLLPPGMRDWVAEDHLVWFLLDVVDRVDTSPFHTRHLNDGAGRAAYDPDMMLALLLYAYCTGVRSSRRIEALCRSDLAYRVICANLVPDHRTIARFRAEHQQAIRDVFVAVLRLCAAAGLTTLASVAIDGTKIGADAALDANRSTAAITAEVNRIMGEAAGVDDHEQALFGAARGDELPAELAQPGSRQARLSAAPAQIKAREAAAQQASSGTQTQAETAAAQGRKVRGRKPKDPAAALARAHAEVAAAKVLAQAKRTRRAAKQAQATARGHKLHGSQPAPDTSVAKAEAALAAALAAGAAAAAAPPAKDAQANVTDPDSRTMKATQGYLQGYNAQAAVNEHQVVVGVGLNQQGNDCLQLLPMMTATAQQLAAAGTGNQIGLVLADAGYWSEANATAAGPDRLIATLKDWKQRRAARELGTTTGPAPDGATPAVAMEHRLRTAEGANSYARRSHTVEPVFGNIKENQGYRRFMRRGLSAVQSEWNLICSAHNLLKLYAHGQAAPA